MREIESVFVIDVVIDRCRRRSHLIIKDRQGCERDRGAGQWSCNEPLTDTLSLLLSLAFMAAVVVVVVGWGYVDVTNWHH
jgi:hypothetical protein